MARAAMGALEALVMEAVWDAPEEWVSVAEVHSGLSQRRKMAYTTVLTTMVRLWRKGRVERRPDGRAYRYRATETRELHAAERMTEMLAGAADRRAALAHFLSGLTSAERAELRRLLGRPWRRG